MNDAFQVFAFVNGAAGGVSQGDVNDKLGEVAKIGFAKAMQNKWVALDKETKLVKATVTEIKDEVREQLALVKSKGADLAALEAALDKKKLEVRRHLPSLLMWHQVT